MVNPAGNLSPNPFDHAFEMLGEMPEVTTDNVNAEALELLTQAMTSRARERGRMVLLRSPRAGFGKTHLLMRLHQRVAHTHEFIPLEPSKGRYLDAQSVLDAVLRRFSRILPAGGGLTVLDLLARRILAAGLEPLVKSGEVPSQDRDSALQALQMRPVETFDFHNEEAVTAQWAMANFALLGPRLTAELAERTHAGYRPVAWWVELLFRYSSASIDQTSRNSSLFETVFGGDSVETDMHEKLVTLLNLTGLVTSPVLILDEVEGFSSNPEAALQVATFLNSLHQSCGKLSLIISVNGDVWETAFLPRIPCGLKDRLSDIVIDLKPMDKEAALKLLKDRAGEHSEAIADTMDFDAGVVYARGLIRNASKVWDELALEHLSSPDAGGVGLQDPISLQTSGVQEEAAADPTEPVVEPERELHAPDAVVVPAVTEQAEEVKPANPALPENLPQPFAHQHEVQAAPESETTDEPAEAPYFGPPKEENVAERSAQELSSAVAQVLDVSEQAAQQVEQSPFNTDNQPASSAMSAEPAGAGHVPRNVIDSPFSIDPSATGMTSPFQPVEPAQAPVPESQSPAAPAAGGQPQATVDSPFKVEGNNPAHTVTDNDHEKVEDLLKQFRDRYGRD